jgi:tRNA 5-methylaminomethyl-2-thiouridine biosynthesis bifunctional protein
MEGFRSAQFDDIYFSPEDGLAETRHVFLAGNDLPESWARKDQGRGRFTIAETGFGTGLNFLAAWELFARTAKPGQVLDYISFEKFPLAPAQIEGALAPWPELKPYLDQLLSQYPIRAAGWHRLVFGNVRLTLIFDDVNAAIARVAAPRGVDAWFLDGFAPAKNPDMWSDVLFGNMARLSAPGARVATFTAAGAVRRGLADSGFAVEKKKGYGRKRDMTAGKFRAGQQSAEGSAPRRVAIIGGGLAGTSCAYILKQYGIEPVIFEAADSLAPGASGNALGLYNPRLSALRGPESDFYTGAFALAVRTLKDKARACGSLHLVTDDDRRKKFQSTAAHWSWHPDHMQYVDAARASEIAGIPVPHEALYLPDAGQASPAALCDAYARDCDIRLGARMEKPEGFDAVILACGIGVRDFADLPLHTVRGQITEVKATALSERLACNLCYGGYLGAAAEGRHMTGATFQRWKDNATPEAEDDADNIAKLESAVPALAGQFAPAGNRAALRVSSKDRFPVAGKLADGLYVSAAHGSHGIVSTLAAAHLIADMMLDGPLSLPADAAALLAPGRFAARERKRHQA